MAAYENPQGTVTGTPEADDFIFDEPLTGSVVADALAGSDQLTVDRSGDQASQFQAGDIFRSGTFYGNVQLGPYGHRLTFYQFERLKFVGSVFDDSFDIQFGRDLAGLTVDISGGGGLDFLRLDFQRLTTSGSLVVENGAITSNLGSFSGLEKFNILAGSGNDIIQTGDEADEINAGSGSDDIRTGGGNDQVYAESGGDYVDMGDGYDFFQGNYTSDTAALTIDLGATLTVSNGVTAINFESVTLGGGSGNDRFNVTRSGVTLYGGSGYDTLNYGVADDEAQRFLVTGYSNMLDGSTANMWFYQMERVELRGGTKDDTFILSGTFASDAISFDGAGGNDLLQADFSALSGDSVLTVDALGTIGSNRGSFAAIERFAITGGGGNDIFATGSGNDDLVGGDGGDNLDGGSGNDRLVGGAGLDTLSGRGGDDILEGGADDDRLDGGSENDDLNGGTGTNQLDGGDGDDTARVIGGATIAASGIDTINLGAGNDHLIVDYQLLTVPVSMSPPSLQPSSLGWFVDIFLGANPNAVHSVAAQGVNRMTITTGSGNDVILPFSTADIISTGAGDDRVSTRSAGADPSAFRFSGRMRVDMGEGFDTAEADWSDLGAANPVVFDTANGAGVTLTAGGEERYLRGVEHLAYFRTGAGADRIALNPGRTAGYQHLYTYEGDDEVTIRGGQRAADNGFFSVWLGNGEDRLILDFSASLDPISMSQFGPNAQGTGLNFGGNIFVGGEFQVAEQESELITIIGGQGDDVIGGTFRSDVLKGNGGADYFYLEDEYYFATNDLVDGGAGTDTLRLNFWRSGGDVTTPGAPTGSGGQSGVFRTGAANDVSYSGIERFEIRTNLGSDSIRTGDGDDRIETGNRPDIIIAGGGNDYLDGGSDADSMTGGAGNDTYLVDNVGDTVIELASEGIDEVLTSLAAYTLPDNVENVGGTAPSGVQTFTGNGLDNLINGGVGIDHMIGKAGNDIYIVDNAGDTVTEVAGEGSADEVRTALADYTLPANVEILTATGTGQVLRGNAGDNRLTGSGGADGFYLQHGGNDSVSGGGGSDGFYFGAQLGGGDRVDGGTGPDDQLVVQGNYDAALEDATLTGIETLVFLSGTDTRFGDTSNNLYDYRLVLADGNVAAGGLLTINANALLAGEDLILDGSAERDGRFAFYAGLGNDRLTGGAQSDGFFFGNGGRFSGADSVNGGAGLDDQLVLRGDYGSAQVVFGVSTMTNIETLVVLSASDTRFAAGGAAFSYNLKTDDANVAAATRLIVSANSLTANERLIFDGSAEADGFFRILSGKGDDNLTGGAGNDFLYGNLGADVLTGGSGADTYFYRFVTESTASSTDTIRFIAGDRIDLSSIDAVTGTPANDAFTWIGENAFSGAAGELRVYQSNGQWLVAGDTDGDRNADLFIVVESAAPMTTADFAF